MKWNAAQKNGIEGSRTGPNAAPVQMQESRPLSSWLYHFRRTILTRLIPASCRYSVVGNFFINLILTVANFYRSSELYVCSPSAQTQTTDPSSVGFLSAAKNFYSCRPLCKPILIRVKLCSLIRRIQVKVQFELETNLSWRRIQIEDEIKLITNSQWLWSLIANLNWLRVQMDYEFKYELKLISNSY